MEATLSEKVAALRSFFGVDPSMPLLPALEAMHSAMSSVPEGALPAQVNAVVRTRAAGCCCSPSHSMVAWWLLPVS